MVLAVIIRCPHCSGLLGRTSLRQPLESGTGADSTLLFRPSRPDFIETRFPRPSNPRWRTNCSGLLGRTSLRPALLGGSDLVSQNCSGLLGRTSLRQKVTGQKHSRRSPNCSGLLGRTSLRRSVCLDHSPTVRSLFRPSRPDFIETTSSSE